MFSISWLLVCVCALVATAGQKLVRQVEVFTDGGFEVPGTIDELWEQSSVEQFVATLANKSGQ